jgi:hypothetical protein
MHKVGGESNLAKFFTALPLKKLSTNQTFDLAFDLLMLVLLMFALIANLGPHQGTIKALLVFICLGLMVWSFKSNS